MIRCNECNTDNEDYAIFCQECGNKIQLRTDTNLERKVFFTDSNNNKTEFKVSIKEKIINIPTIDFLSVSAVQSKDGNLVLATSDQYFTLKNGNRERVDGKAIFINKDKLFLIPNVERPHDGKMAENGNFIFNDWMYDPGLCGTFYAFDSGAKLLLKQKFNSNLAKNGLSNNGRYAVVETAISKSDDQDSIFFFDIMGGKLLWERKRDVKNVKEFVFDDDLNILTVFYDNNRSYRQRYNGEFLDNDKLEKERITRANGYELFRIAKEKMDKIEMDNSQLSDYTEVLLILDKSLNKSISPNTKAQIHRVIGEIYYDHGRNKETLDNFEKALSYNPNIGVKRLYKQLKEEKEEF